MDEANLFSIKESKFQLEFSRILWSYYLNKLAGLYDVSNKNIYKLSLIELYLTWDKTGPAAHLSTLHQYL